MSNLFEISGSDIAELNDSDLRTLIGLLCEADYRLAGLSTKGITWGGNQDAKDGGLDVVVASKENPPKNSFIPKKNTGFQVKKPDMPRAEILKEMKPKGIVREAIKTLIQKSGAYIIVSSTGSTTDTALKNRLEAMREALGAEKNNSAIELDFFDRGRVATWVRLHPSLILWVRNKISRPLIGWRPYENWANPKASVEEEYLLDEGVRLLDGTKPNEKGVSVKAGLVKLRSALSVPGASVRLAGLSGMGKTRFVQALFDERIEKSALNRFQVFYTDISDGPTPDPRTFAEQLIAENTKAVLIVDNCPPDLHRTLTQTCSKVGSTVSLLTVEYDVRDDLPDETSVFRLEPSSDEIIKQLVLKRFSHFSHVDAETITKFAGGNARLAIALARTIEQGETLSGFRDEQLFERLFKQRNDQNESLLRSAEVCSLVYSFEGTDTNSDKSELAFLSSLIGKSSAEIYRDVAELKARGLVQSRGVWRALLPHAIANRLAKRALASIPKDTLTTTFLSASERLIKSFTRRLNFLHDCKEAIEIVDSWLAKDGWIDKGLSNLSPFGMEVFKNVVPVSPERALEAIERTANGPEGSQFTSRENNSFYEFVRLLRQLAYDPKLFQRSVRIICRYALTEKKGENYNSVRNILQSLFQIYLSGTHATIESRAEIINELVNSNATEAQELGLLLLDSALEAWHFSSGHEFDFGARPRNYGYEPKTRKDVVEWYEAFIGICTRLATSGKPIAVQAKNVLSRNLRGLWSKAGMADIIEKAIDQILQQGPWNEGWISIRGIIRYDAKPQPDGTKGMPKKILDRLVKLETKLKPNDLLERARTFALTESHQIFALEDDDGSASNWQKVENTTREIGIEVSKNPDVFQTLLPSLVSAQNTSINAFGAGLAEGSKNKLETWNALYAQLQKTPSEKRRLGVFIGFLCAAAKIDAEFHKNILDSLIGDNLLGTEFPLLQTTGTIDARGLGRLHKALDFGTASIHQYKRLAWGRAHESISDDDLATLLRHIDSKEGGLDVVLEILKMRFHGSKNAAAEYSKDLLAVARQALSGFTFSRKIRSNDNLDHELSSIANICLLGKESVPTTQTLSRNLSEAVTKYDVYSHDYPELLQSIAKLQPATFLDVFLSSNDLDNYRLGRIFSGDFDRANPLDLISDAEILDWCDKEPEKRYPIIAETVNSFRKSSKTGLLEWKPIVYSIIEKAPDLKPVLNALAEALYPNGWSGSKANILQKRLNLFQSLYNHQNAEVRSWAQNSYTALQEQITRERAFEDTRYRERDESFE